MIPGMRGRSFAILVVAVALLGGSCGGGSTAPADGECLGVRVVATTSVLGDVVRNVLGEAGDVEVLMPVGADPHSFQVSARQAAAMREADLLVVNGLGLEEGMTEAIDGAAAEGTALAVAASFIQPLPVARPGEGHGAWDPHLWTDPRRMGQVVAGLAGILAGLDPDCAAEWRGQADAYLQELLALDGEIEDLVAAVPEARRVLVTNHGSLAYFADRYGFEVLGTLIPGGDTLAAPSPADLAALVEAMRDRDVRAIFAETTRPTDVAEAVAAEVGDGVRVVSLYTGSLGPEGSGAETYITMQRTNARLIVEALGR